MNSTIKETTPMINKIFKTNGPGLFESIKHAAKHGGREYFIHNLSCELRRGRDRDCYGYKNTWYDRFLFSIGVWLMDPTGFGFWRRTYNHRLKYGRYDPISDGQWLRHPLPWVRWQAKRLCALKKKKLEKQNA